MAHPRQPRLQGGVRVSLRKLSNNRLELTSALLLPWPALGARSSTGCWADDGVNGSSTKPWRHTVVRLLSTVAQESPDRASHLAVACRRRNVPRTFDDQTPRPRLVSAVSRKRSTALSANTPAGCAAQTIGTLGAIGPATNTASAPVEISISLRSTGFFKSSPAISLPRYSHQAVRSELTLPPARSETKLAYQRPDAAFIQARCKSICLTLPAQIDTWEWHTGQTCGTWGTRGRCDTERASGATAAEEPDEADEASDALD